MPPKTTKKRSSDLSALPEQHLSLLAAKLLREGRMPGAGRLADALAAGGSHADTARVKLARPAGEPYHVVFVSSNDRDEASTIHQAKAGLTSPRFGDLIQLSHAIPAVSGGRSGIGFWKDGAEESRLVHLKDPNAVRYVAARLGKAFRQKAAIGFTSGAGGDVAHVLRVPESDPEKIAKDMMDHGIEYKTIVPHRTGSTVHVLDMNGDISSSVEGYARQSGAEHTRHLGTVHWVGEETREAADKLYDEVLSKESHRGL